MRVMSHRATRGSNVQMSKATEQRCLVFYRAAGGRRYLTLMITRWTAFVDVAVANGRGNLQDL